MNLTGEQWGAHERDRQLPPASHGCGRGTRLQYQVPGWSNSGNIDMIAIYMTGVATLLLLAVPFIPGLRDVPRLIPVHRLIWRRSSGPGSDETPPPAGKTGPVGTATADKS